MIPLALAGLVALVIWRWPTPRREWDRRYREIDIELRRLSRRVAHDELRARLRSPRSEEARERKHELDAEAERLLDDLGLPRVSVTAKHGAGRTAALTPAGSPRGGA